MKRSKEHIFYIFVILLTIFGFPLIAVINYRIEMTTNILSLLYRGVVVILLFFSLYKLHKDKKHRIVTHVTYALIIFWVYYLIKLVIDLYWFQLTPKMEIFQQSPTYYLIFATLLCFFPMIAFLFIGQKVDVKRLNKWLFTYISIINIIYFFVFIEKGIYNLFTYTGRLSLLSQYTSVEYLNAITVAQYSVYYFILLYYLEKIRLIHIIIGICPLIILVFAASKGPILSFIATMLLVHFFRYKVGNNKIIAVLISLSAGIFILWYFNVSLEDLLLYNRILAGAYDESQMIRQAIFIAALEQFSSNIILGTHYYVVKMNAFSHNLILDVLLSTGLLGFFFFSKAIFGLGKSFMLTKFDNPLSALIIFQFILAMSSGYVFALTDFWALIGLYLGIQFNKTNVSLNTTKKI